MVSASALWESIAVGQTCTRPLLSCGMLSALIGTVTGSCETCRHNARSACCIGLIGCSFKCCTIEVFSMIPRQRQQNSSGTHHLTSLSIPSNHFACGAQCLDSQASRQYVLLILKSTAIHTQALPTAPPMAMISCCCRERQLHPPAGCALLHSVLNTSTGDSAMIGARQ